MKTKVSPVVAVLAVAVVGAVIWFCYTRVFTGQTVGQNSPPAAAAGGLSKAGGAPAPPPPGGGVMSPPKTRPPRLKP